MGTFGSAIAYTGLVIIAIMVFKIDLVYICCQKVRYESCFSETSASRKK